MSEREREKERRESERLIEGGRERNQAPRTDVFLSARMTHTCRNPGQTTPGCRLLSWNNCPAY